MSKFKSHSSHGSHSSHRSHPSQGSHSSNNVATAPGNSWNTPQAKDDTGAVSENGVVQLDVLGNDNGGNSISLFSLDQANPSAPTGPGELVALPSGAQIMIVGDQVVYDTNNAFESLALGETTFETFTYTIRMGNGTTSTAEVTVKITGQNDAPTVADVTGMADEDGAAIDINLAGDDIDSDDDGTTLTYTIVSGPAEGSASISGDVLNFNPGMDFQDLAAGDTRDVTITYQATDSHGAPSNISTVTVTVTGVNDIAAITGDTGEVTEDGTLVAGGTVIVSDADTGQSGTQAQTDVAGTYGTFSIDNAGVWSYLLDNDDPLVQALNTGDTPTDSFTVFSSDGSASTTVDITVNGVNDSTNTDPVADGDVIIASLSTDAVIPVEWLLQNDGDIDGDMLTVTAIDDTGLPAGWVVAPIFVAGNLVSFTVTTPGADTAPLVLNYTVSDGNGGTVMSTVTIALAGPSTAGADTFDLSAEDYNFSYIEGKAGNDTATGGSEVLAPTSTGTVGSDIFIGGDGDDKLIGGMGDDTLHGGNLDGSDLVFATNDLIGEAENIGGGVPGDPVIDGIFTGGNDTIFGGDGANNNIYGDNFGTVVLAAGQEFIGGDDVLTGGNGAADTNLSSILIGDSQSVFSNDPATFTGGDDVLTGGSGVNFLNFSGFVFFFQNNTLVGDVTSNGNANTTFVGGDDILISGALAADIMTGDFASGSAGSVTAGSDTFVFGLDNGSDIITDFQSGTDLINLFDTGLTFLDLDSDGSGTLDASDDFISIASGATVIDLGDATGSADGAGVHRVTVDGVIDLVETDFDFGMLIV